MKNVRKYLLTVIACVSFAIADAQYATTIEVTNLNDAALTAKANRNISTLLTELNAAQAENRGLDFKKLALTPDAQVTLSVLWEVCPFRCSETEIVERGMSTSVGYQVRSIPVMMQPLQGETFDSDKNQEVVINFNISGQITNICFTISQVQYAKIMRSSNPVDLYRRQIVLDFIENFRTAYNRKDMPYLQKVYSDDALIITGNVIKTKTDAPVIKYTTQSKQEYLTKLQGAFNKNPRINIEFEEIKVTKHQDPRKEHIYGVTLKQHWNSTNYSDVGYLFLMMDFKDEQNPLIHVRTWQPDDPAKPLPKSDVFSLSDFEGKF